MRLDFATHKMRVNVVRHGVNVGTKMDQKRIDVNLKVQGRQRLTDYIKELYEEFAAAHMAGSRGVGDEFDHLPEGYAGYPNELVAPDDKHIFVGTLGNKTKTTLTSDDKLNLQTINALQLKAKKMLGRVQDGRPVRMQKTKYGGKDAFVLVTMPEGMQDIRNDSGTAGWIDAQRALTTAIGRDSELFKGGAGWFNGVITDEVDVGVKFNDYGTPNTVKAMRSLFCGASAGIIAHGTKGMDSGLSIELTDDTDDRGFEHVINFMMIFGFDKAGWIPTVTNGTRRDVGVISVDHAYSEAA